MTGVGMNGRRRRHLAVKRAIDLLGATVALVVLSPVLAATAVALLVTQGRPIFFRQQRPGLGGRPFTIVKFRTMRSPRPGEVWYATDPQRVTRIGRILRSTSLDELPELWNVLRGEMSLVGPRPLLVEFLANYTPEEARRHEMRPGVTGWAVVNGRQGASFEERFRLDVWYVDHWSLGLDARIIGRTISQVLRRTDASAAQGMDDIELPARLESGLQSATTPGPGATPAVAAPPAVAPPTADAPPEPDGRAEGP
jgi:lipopolysaccharide/colanic/teichoic acid biosynthesis glycosyltransferase